MITKDELQIIYFDLCDLLSGEIPFGYESKKDCIKSLAEMLEPYTLIEEEI